jgi:hypothetical protein
VQWTFARQRDVIRTDKCFSSYPAKVNLSYITAQYNNLSAWNKMGYSPHGNKNRLNSNISTRTARAHSCSKVHNFIKHMRFQVLMATSMNMAVFWDVSGRSPWWWTQWTPSELRSISTRYIPQDSYLLHQAKSLRTYWWLSWSRNATSCIQTEGILLCLQGSATGLYLEPN